MSVEADPIDPRHRSGRTPIQVECRNCGILWSSLGAGAEFTQPALELFARHAARCDGRAILLSRLVSIGGAWFDLLEPGVVIERGQP